MPDNPSPTDVIQQQAFELLQAHARRDGTNTQAAIKAFCDKSPAHAEALEQAQLLQGIAPSLRDEKESLWDAIWLWLDVRWARWVEARPGWRLAAAIPVAAVLVLTFQLMQAPPEIEQLPVEVAQAPIEYATRWQETREFTMSDGSTAWLDWRTSISESFDDTARHVTVHRGKVAFDVVSNADRPFIVQAGDVTTEVTGTEFVVHFLTESNVEVSVMEGQVIVATDEAASALLNAAEAVLARGSVLGEVTTRASEDMGRWREGLLVYRERLLTDALHELAGYTLYSIDLSRVQETERRISGVFYKDQAEDALFTVLEGQDLTFTYSSNRLIIEPKPLF